jgi:hypothetical protein
VVGLIEDGDLDGIEVDVALADEVFETSRAGDDDVDAGAQGGDLRAWPTPPKTVRDVSPVAFASGASDSSICATSSRVGARISARGAAASGDCGCWVRRATSGKRKA